jgi:hypothetical protein
MQRIKRNGFAALFAVLATGTCGSTCGGPECTVAAGATYEIEILGTFLGGPMDHEPCPPFGDINQGDKLLVRTEQAAGDECGRVLHIQDPPATYVEWELKGERPSDVGTSYRIRTISGCMGTWFLYLRLPPNAQELGAPCDDCILVYRYIVPDRSQCSELEQPCQDAFYANFTRID